MTMHIATFARNMHDNDTAHVVVRMNKATHQALRLYMHAQDDIVFPRNVRLAYRGFGWYRLDAMQSNDARAKLEFALRIIHKFLHTQRRAANEDAKLARLSAQGHQVNAYVSGAHGHAGRFVVADAQIIPRTEHEYRIPILGEKQPPMHARPASAASLAALAAHFAR